MNGPQQIVLDAIYRAEETRLRQSQFNFWLTPQDITAAIHPGQTMPESEVRQLLRELWMQRRLMQVCFDDSPVEAMGDVELDDLDQHGTESKLAIEQDDVRGVPASTHLQVAIYPLMSDVRYRSRIAEIGRMLSYNYQRFNMAPATGLLRYERRPQRRPGYTQTISEIISTWTQNLMSGRFEVPNDLGSTDQFSVDGGVDRARLSQAITGVLMALADQFAARHRPSNLAPFQVRSIIATLSGLYSQQYKQQYQAQVVTAGVGSGKSFAFQIGALIHVAHRAILGDRRLQVLLLYPRVVLAANQFQDLLDLVARTSQRLGGVTLRKPLLDAGGQLRAQLGIPEQQGATLQAIRTAYQSDYQIVISNLDTLANRIVHPESAAGLVTSLDLVVFDEVHLLSGIYGGHARMLLRRIELMREMRRLREQLPAAHFEELLQQRSRVTPPYFVAASATISEPRQHTARLLSRSPSKVLHIGAGVTDETGWVHHFFLRQRPEVSSQTAVINATACLIHNRRNGVFREYYQRSDGNPISLSDLPNPTQPGSMVGPRDTSDIHKTLGFCDSLDAIGSWADLVGDNEQTKFVSMQVGPSPSDAELPYFVRFQEPLWRTVHHSSFRAQPEIWKEAIRTHYGEMCQKCKQGVRCTKSRIPTGLTVRQSERVNGLWSGDTNNADSYVSRLHIDGALYGASWFLPLHQASTATQIGNLDQCAFFQTGLCWWWSLDDLGSNRPAPAAHQTPVQGFKQPVASNERRYHAVNAIRLRTFTSNDREFDVTNLNSVNDIFRASGSRVFRGRSLGQTQFNSLFVIGSPRIEVGIDMSRVMDGITFRSMRDPASFQQKVGRIGRELQADSLAVHVVTGNLREQYYFRNPRIALDPDYLQPIPLHERNALVARNHYFMAIVDFLCMQGEGPGIDRIGAHGERIDLVNDQAHGGFSGWSDKVTAVFNYLFGNHPRHNQNRQNLRNYLMALGATAAEAEHPSQAILQTQPAQGIPIGSVGAIDVFRHDFGPGLLQTPIVVAGSQVTLAQVCQYPRSVTTVSIQGLPRHQQFFREYYSHGGDGVMTRSYLWQILTLPIFRRGVPALDLRGNQPWLWVPSLFEAVGNESVQVFQITQFGRNETAVETASLAIALLCPGTFTYRYYNDTGPLKVPVSSGGALGITPLSPGIEAVRLNIGDPDFYEDAGCQPLAGADLPDDFHAAASPVRVFRPRQIALTSANSNPCPIARGLIADMDEAPFPQAPERIYNPLPKPPQSFALRWYRVAGDHLEQIPCRFVSRFTPSPGAPPFSPLPWPVVMRLFTDVYFDEALEITDFVWGLDRTFTTRDPEAARLVYRHPIDPVNEAIAIGQHYKAPGFEFRLNFELGSPVATRFQEIMGQPQSAVYQSLLWQVLHAFVSDYARSDPPPNSAPWIVGGRASTFTIQNLVKVVAFHLLDRWLPNHQVAPAPRFRPTIADVRCCFDSSHANFIDNNRFDQVCELLAQQQNPVDVQTRLATLLTGWANFSRATQHAHVLDDTYFATVMRRIYLNSLGLSLHAAALRLSGAEDSDLAYFFKETGPGSASIFLFDTDQYGNGTAQLLRDHFYISAAERTLNARLAALGLTPDPLPTIDFVSCLEETLQECKNSQAGHIAFHDMSSAQEPFADLEGAVDGERQSAGVACDFVRLVLGQSSYDDVLPFQVCPEFLAHIASPVSGYAGAPLVGSPHYATFQSLESAMGMCIHGCIECVVAPEQNIRGPLAAMTSVNKLLLDAVYAGVVCGAIDTVASIAFPAQGTGRTCMWPELTVVVAAANAVPVPGAASLSVRLLPSEHGNPAVDLTVTAAATPGPWTLVLRPNLATPGVPQARVRPRMML